MDRLRKGASQDKGRRSNRAAAPNMDLLIAELTCNDVRKCRRARQALVAIGEKAVEPLIDALAHRKGWVRWEAAKALGQIRGQAATDALVHALDDRNFDVRWLAAEGLISRGREGMIPLLQALIARSDSAWLRDGAHHVFHDLSDECLKKHVRPVLAALEELDPAVEVPLAARTALEALERESA